MELTTRGNWLRRVLRRNAPLSGSWNETLSILPAAFVAFRVADMVGWDAAPIPWAMDVRWALLGCLSIWLSHRFMPVGGYGKVQWIIAVAVCVAALGIELLLP